MIDKNMSLSVLVASSLVFAACIGDGGNGDGEDEARDLTLPPPAAISAIDDEPEPEAERPAPPPRPAPRREPEPEVVEPEPEPEPEPPSLAAGTTMSLVATDTVTSRRNHTGDSVSATLSDPLRDENGDILIPAGAVFSGTISDIAPAETPGGEGRMEFSFTQVSFDGAVYPVEARLDSAGTRMEGRGVTAGDAAKVGAGAVIGGLAGRVLGGNRTGTAVGAVAGAAAGVGIAAATRDVDIILDAGATIRLVLTAAFVR
jgi:hypothetical protein